MAIFKKDHYPTPAPAPAEHAPAAAPQIREVTPEAGLREKIAKLSLAIDTFVSGDLRDADVTMTIASTVGAGFAPRHFPDDSIWAKSVPFADRAAAIGEWLIIVKLYQLCAYWNDDALPQFSQINPQFVEMVGWARPHDRSALRDKAFDAAQQLDPFVVAFPASGETVGDILFAESFQLGRTADWLANPVPPPPPPPTARERIDAVVERARQGDADAVAYENALRAPTDEQARRYLDEAASLGSVDAMEAAAEMAHAAGDAQSELFWAETAANAGSIRAMMRLTAILFDTGRANEGIAWLDRAGQAGDPEAYWLLAKMANEAGDHASAQRWADVGARAGNAECMRLKASYLLSNVGNAGMENVGRAHAWFVQAARRGSDKAMLQLGELAQTLGNQDQALYWFKHGAARGNPEAVQHLSGGA